MCEVPIDTLQGSNVSKEKKRGVFIKEMVHNIHHRVCHEDSVLPAPIAGILAHSQPVQSRGRHISTRDKSDQTVRARCHMASKSRGSDSCSAHALLILI